MEATTPMDPLGMLMSELCGTNNEKDTRTNPNETDHLQSLMNLFNVDAVPVKEKNDQDINEIYDSLFDDELEPDTDDECDESDTEVDLDILEELTNVDDHETK